MRSDLLRGSEAIEEFCCEGKRRTNYAVTVKRLSSGSVRGVVHIQRKESREEKRRTE